jgi:two-component system LytT family response regulator
VKELIRAVIIDDVASVILILKKLLSHFPNIEIVGEASDVDDAVELINGEKPDLIFLDVDLNGLTSLDMLKEIKHDPMIVFITSHADFALKAFELNATDYLLKPISSDRLTKSIEKVFNKWSRKNEEQTAGGDENKKLTADSMLMLTIDDKLVFVKVRDITHIEAFGNYTKVYTVDKKMSVTYNSVKSWLSKLPDDIFIQIHRSTVVNMEYVNGIEKWTNDTGRLSLADSKEPFEVSRNYFFELKKRYKI